MKKKAFAMVLSFLTTICLFPAVSLAANSDVAEVNGTKYETLKKAVENAPDGSTVTLLSDVTEDITFDKNITVDGGSKYTISGLSTVKAGTLQNLTLKPNETNSKGSLLSLGNSSASTSIQLENVTVHYSVTKRDGGSAVTASGNKADITINRCHFINTPNNNGVTIEAPEWSYGLYINGQDDTGRISFTNSEFNGAFRTMLPNVSGNFLIENCNFTNSVYSVSNGPTSGAGLEATTITTSTAANNQIVVKNNTFDNAGSIYLQTQADFTGNTIKYDKFEHYIQVKGSIGTPVDFRENTFQAGANDLIIIDVAATPILLPAGQPAVNYWVWADTPDDVRPADYRDYKYRYNEDGTITFMPQSDVALEQFFLQKDSGNIQVNTNDTVLIEKDLKLKDLVIEADKKITFEIAEGSTLEITGDLAIQGNVMVTGGGKLIIQNQGTVSVDPEALFEVSLDTQLENNGTITNHGEVTIPDHTAGTGTLEGSGSVEKLHNAKHIEAVAPTCDTAGNIEYWYCDYCNKHYSDPDLTQEISKEKTVLKALGHKYKDGICTVCGKADPNTKPNTPQTNGQNSGTSNQKPANSRVPKTGDTNHIGWLLTLSLGSLLTLLVMKRYNNKKADK